MVLLLFALHTTGLSAPKTDARATDYARKVNPTDAGPRKPLPPEPKDYTDLRDLTPDEKKQLPPATVPDDSPEPTGTRAPQPNGTTAGPRKTKKGRPIPTKEALDGSNIPRYLEFGGGKKPKN